MIPGWTPPEKLKPVTPQAYATLRLYIESGCAWTKLYIEKYSLEIFNAPIQRKPGLSDMAVKFFDYVPAESVPLAPAQAIRDQLQPQLTKFPLIDEDRPGWPTFISRTTLINALNAVTPPEVLAQVGSLDRPPDAAGTLGMESAANAQDDSGAAAGLALEWWALALTAGGVLYWLGKTNFAGVMIGLLARQLLKFLVVAGAVVLFTDAAGAIIEKLGKQAAGAARSLMPLLLLGLGGALGVGALVVVRRRRSSSRKSLAAAR